MKKNVIEISGAPKPVGPYNHLIQIGDLFYSSGQIPLDPESGALVSDDITKQAHQVLENVKALLTSANLDFQNIVKCTLFLTDMGDFAAINAVYSQYFTSDFPARSTVEVSKLPLGAKFELEFVASS